MKNFLFFIAGIFFGTGFLFLLLGFHSFSKYNDPWDELRALYLAFFCYPISIILVGILIWLLNRKNLDGTLQKFAFAVLGLIVPGLFFYSGNLEMFPIGSKTASLVGVILILVSTFIFSRKRLKIRN